MAGAFGLMTAPPRVRNPLAGSGVRIGAALDRQAVWLGCVAALCLLQIALIVQHTPWLDEWQALLIAVQSPDGAALIENLRFEGHPPLWYAVLLGWSQLVPFEWVLKAAALSVALTMQAVILWRAPFPRAERLLLCLGEIALFEYGTLARSLALGALLMVAAAALWRGRWAWLPIALLPMCDFLFGVVALLLTALLVAERRLSAWGLAALALASALAAWSVWPDPRMIPAERPLGFGAELGDLMFRLGGLLFPFQTFGGRIAWDGYPPYLTGSILAVLFLLWMRQRFAARPRELAATFALLAACCVTSLALYSLHFRHLSVIAWFVIVLAWIYGQPSEREHERWRLWLIAGALCGVATAAVALSTPFDAAPRVARAMTALDDGRRPWLVHPPRHSVALAAELRRPLFSPQQGCSQTFVRWNFGPSLRSPRKLRTAMTEWADRYGQAFLVVDPLPRNVPRDVFLPLTGKMRGYNGQGYVIGILGPNRPIKPLADRPCVHGLKPLA